MPGGKTRRLRRSPRIRNVGSLRALGGSAGSRALQLRRRPESASVMLQGASESEPTFLGKSFRSSMNCLLECLLPLREDGSSGKHPSRGLDVTVLFLGPFALESVVEEQARSWTRALQAQLGLPVKVVVGEPQFSEQDDIECKGDWFKPQAWKLEEQVRKMRTQVLSGLQQLLRLVVQHRPRIILGAQQAGVVTALAGLPRPRNFLPSTPCASRRSASGGGTPGVGTQFRISGSFPGRPRPSGRLVSGSLPALAGPGEHASLGGPHGPQGL